MARLCIFVCLLLVVVVSAQLANAQECSSGEVKQEDCNTCSCIPPGLWACTKIKCPRKIEVTTQPEVCSDGETTSFDNGCNTCSCIDGHWACTLKFCLPTTPESG